MSYDDYDAYDDQDFDDDEPPEAINDCEALLRRAVDIVATARTFPMSSSPMINREEMVELLEEALERMPEELRQARWMLKERQDFIDKTKREAADILDAGRAQAERMVQRQEVVRAAEMRARKVIEAAENEARRMKLEVEDFCDQRLASFEIVLERTLKTVAVGREKLNGRMHDTRPPAPPEPEVASNFFDQDQF
jgi:cell division septum initiation protein DivIVA